ncbi:MAG: hypothetical protein RLZZ626_568 [Actinomycetota bacterium]|jgi:DNA polymerase-3 subunit delta
MVSEVSIVDWRRAAPAPLVLIVGPETYLGDQAIRGIREKLRADEPNLEIHEIQADDYTQGELLALSSPSLFSEPRLVVVKTLENASSAFVADLQSSLSQPVSDTTLVLRHSGAVGRAKGVLDTVRQFERVEIKCEEVSVGERPSFIQAHFASQGRKITQDGVRALTDAFADDLVELAAACDQLLQDATGDVNAQIVDTYFGGRVETNSFKVVDAAIAGRTGEALSLMRHALSTGSDPIAINAAFAMKIRQIAKVLGNRTANPAALGMAPWQMKQALKAAGGWNDDGLARVIVAIADADAAAKGGERQPAFALERLIQLVGARGEVS